ncbi:DUF1667 domain-containing protein [Peptostreptococcaceae bacterium AGR-M142]
MKKDLVCIVCPRGCRLTLVEDKASEKGYKVEGNICKRGVDYAIKEVTNPTRVITTTVVIENALLNRLPVKTLGEVPKEKIFECMKEIDKVRVNAPVNVGDVIIKDICNTGVDIVSSKTM